MDRSSNQGHAPIMRPKRVQVVCRINGPIHVYLREKGWKDLAYISGSVRLVPRGVL